MLSPDRIKSSVYETYDVNTELYLDVNIKYGGCEMNICFIRFK